MLSLVVPTMNRSDFLIRLLDYYISTDYKHWIYIGDSSNDFHLTITYKKLKQIGSKLKIKYFEYPGLDPYECCQRLFLDVFTPYAVLHPDDDYMVPSALDQSMSFLENNPEYCGAHGLGITAFLYNNSPYGKLRQIRFYPQPIMTKKTAAERITEHFINYRTMFSVFKTEILKFCYQDVPNQTEITFKGELIPCALTVIKGKIKQLDILSLVRQNHLHRFQFPSVKDWILHPNWKFSYEVFKNVLANEISSHDKIDINEANDIAHKAFTNYLYYRDDIQTFLQSATKAQQEGLLSQFPGLRKKYIDNREPYKQEVDFKKMINSGVIHNNYHKFFLPIYESFAKEPVEYINNDQLSHEQKITQGEELFKNNKLEEARKLFLSITEPSEVVFNNLGVISFLNNKNLESINYFVRALEINPYYKEAIVNCHKVFEKTNQYNPLFSLVLLRYLKKNSDDKDIYQILKKVKLREL